MKKGKSKAEALPSRIESIAVKDIRANAWNKRRAVADEFVESIRVNGILQPPVVRAAGKGFELIAGERRWDAAKRAGMDRIVCKVVEATDERARELTLVENIDRENLTALEEAAEIAELVNINAGGAREVAARLGRSIHFVKSRLALSRLDLTIFDNSSIDPELVPVACLELLAKAPRDTQAKIVDVAYGGLNDYETLRNAIVQLSRKLGDKLFDGDDETLVPEAGACNACPKRTGADPDLFGNVAGLTKGDHCLDDACFASKVRAARVRKEADLRKKHPYLLLVAKAIPYEDRAEAEKRKVELVDQPYRCKLESAKKGDEGAVPAFVWSGPGAGSLAWVKPMAGEKLPANARPKTLEEKSAILAKRRLALVAQRAVEIVHGEKIHESFDTFGLLLGVCLKFGCDAVERPEKEDALEAVSEATRHYRARKIDQTEPSRDQIVEALRYVYGDDNERQLALMEKEAAEAIPEPKSWSKE